MSSEVPKRAVDDDLFAGAFAALLRARKRAEDVARTTGTCLIEAVDGKPVRVAPPPLSAAP
jgi:hypothetical protein